MLKTLMALATLTLTALPAFADHEGLHINSPYARVSTENAQSGAIFFEIENHGDADRLIGAASDVSEKAELHTHLEDANGVMQMIQIEGGIEIPAHGGHALARGGDHVMLLGLTRSLKQGDMINLTLTFEQAGDVLVQVPVDNERKAEGGHEGHDMQGHGDHGAKEGHAGHGDHAAMEGHAGHGDHAAFSTEGMTDDQAIVAVMKAQFETPEAALDVSPVAVLGDAAIAAWEQGE
jgi:copper(I)-binding protein